MTFDRFSSQAPAGRPGLPREYGLPPDEPFFRQRDVALLDRRKGQGRVSAPCRALRQAGDVNRVSTEADPDGGVRSLGRPGSRLLTVHTAMRFWWPAVVASAPDPLPATREWDEVRDGNLLYMGADTGDGPPGGDLGRAGRLHRPGPEVKHGRPVSG